MINPNDEATLLDVLMEEEARKRERLCRGDALLTARKLMPEHYLGAEGLKEFEGLWKRYERLSKFLGAVR